MKLSVSKAAHVIAVVALAGLAAAPPALAAKPDAPTMYMQDASLSVSENAGQVDVTVVRSSDKGRVTATVVGSVISGLGDDAEWTDFWGGSYSYPVAFSGGVSTVTVSVPIHPDADQDSEVFHVAVQTPSGRYQVAMPNLTRVTIVDGPTP